MRLTDAPRIKPHHCAAIPYVGQSKQGERWVDTGSELPGFDNHVYLSESAVQEAAELLGFPTPHAHAQLAAELADALAENARLIDALREFEQARDAVEAIFSS